MNANKYPFPFFGAGNAEYYEWAGITIRFVNEPTKADKKQIQAMIPEPLISDEEIFYGKMMSCLSEQFVNMWIEQTYGDEESNEELDEDAGLEFQASDKAKEAFEKDIENWLVNIHTFCAIEFAFRAEDGEAGGTELSDWHTQSLNSTKQLIDKWATDSHIAKHTKDEAEYFNEAVQGILEYSGLDQNDLDQQLVQIIYPDLEIRQLLASGNIEGINTYLGRLKGTPHDQHQGIMEILEEFLESLCEDNEFEQIYYLRSLFYKKILQGKSIGAFIYAAWLAKDTTLIRETFELTGHPCVMANNINVFIYSYLFPEKKWEDAIQLFTIALDLDTGNCEYLEVFCNALYVCQNDNTGLPIDKSLNEKFLAKCLPYGPKNPAIYFNAACLYVEMKDFANTLECIRLAKEHEYDGYDAMMEEIARAGIFSEFLQYPAFKEWDK